MRWIFCLCVSGIAFASFEEAFEKFVSMPGIKEASVSCVVEDRFEYEGDKSRTPESVQKMLTTAMALDRLGPDFQFVTRLCRAGDVKHGVLVGDLVIVGDGDPTLASARSKVNVIDRWMGAIRRADIRMINGRIVADDSCFEKGMAAGSWMWEDLGNYFGAGPSGLSFADNSYTLTFEPNELGERATVVKGPSTLYSEVTTAEEGTGDNAWIYGSEYGDTQIVRGTIPQGEQIFSLQGANPNPPLSAARALHEALEKDGSVISHPPVVKAVGECVVIDEL